MKAPGDRPLDIWAALEKVLRESSLLPVERVARGEAIGRLLAEPVTADTDLPPFAKSMMDGYALRAEDLRTLPAELAVVEEIPAGRVPVRRLAAGEAARIMTGAPVPEGADAVQMVEKTERLEGGSRVRVLEAVERGASVAPPGSDVRAGDELAEAGRIVTPALLGVLAMVGAGSVAVRRRPRVWVASTGDELVPADTVPPPGRIRNSNSPALAAAARALGAEVEEAGILPDDPEVLAAAIGKGLESDLVLLSGGVSMGEYDRVEEALASLGVEFFFRQIAIRPGKPAVFGRKGSCLMFGLPGNPVSSMVVFEVLAAPAVRKMQGRPRPEGTYFEARLEEAVRQRPGRTAFLPGRLSFAGDAFRVRPLPTQGSADLPSHARGNVLFIIPSDRSEMTAGERVRILPLFEVPFE